MRARARLVAAVAAACASACGPPEDTRRFDVAVTESFESYACKPFASSALGADALNQVVAAANEAKKQFDVAHAGQDPKAQGRTLVVTRREGLMRSWFEGPTGQEGVACYPVGYGCGIDLHCCSGTCDPATYLCTEGLELGPGEVYVGAPDEEIVEGLYELSHDVPPPAGDLGTSECEDLVELRASLGATLDGDLLDGRVRRVDIHYPLPIGGDFCQLRYECARDYVVEGVQE